jgi:hypothetical protein
MTLEMIMAKKAKPGRLAVYNEGNGVEFIVAITKVSSFSFSGIVIYVSKVDGESFTDVPYKVGHTDNDWSRGCEFFKFTSFKKFNFLDV